MSSVDGSVSDGKGGLRRLSLWSAPIAGLVGFWLWLAFSSGGYIASHWLPASLALGLFALVVSLTGAFPQRPGQLAMALLAVFGAYAVWVALSAVWAESTTRVWMESGRTFTYLLVFALALIYFTDASARHLFRYLVIAAALVVLIACIVKLWTTDNLPGLFVEVKRFAYPVTATNQAGTLFLIGFWPLMWLASSSKEHSPVRGLALGVATGLVGLTVMTQSRGAIWSLGLSMLLMFAIAPARLRLLFYLVVPALLMVYEFPTLDRYWLEGPAAVGGGVGARTVLVATIVAAFIGMILALLERWVKVSLRMKAIFGTVILAGAIAGFIFWAVTSTSDVGGPLRWVSQTWRQFTSVGSSTPSADAPSRLSLVTSTGRVEIWRVAIEEFEQSPVLGVGADNFVFQYYRERTAESYKPQQAHSIELQALSETGSIGGALLFGGVLLALGTCLWPRYVAGWRNARATWLRRRTNHGPPEQTASPGPVCNACWGNDPAEYGWEMALLAGSAFWLVHASVDWVWQMMGVTIPAFLLLAAAVAAVDARAGVVWPRLQRWLRVREPDSVAVVAPETDRTDRASPSHGQSLLTQVFRALIVTLSAVLLLVAGLPYLSIQFQSSALALAETDGVRAVGRANAARYLVPSDPGPYLTEAAIYEEAATQALEQGETQSAGAVLDNLALAITSYEKAIATEPANWTSHFHAGIAMLDMLIARGYVEGWASLQGVELPAILGLEDWSALAGSGAEPASPGLTPGSLAQDEETRAQAASIRALSADAQASTALGFLKAAQERNPLASQIDTALDILARVAP